jgi:hypothetical protein
MSRTPYAETEFLLAVMEGDTAEAERLADDMLPNERRVFRNQLLEAVELIGDAGL